MVWDGECILAARFGTTVREPSRPHHAGHFPRGPPGRWGRHAFIAGAAWASPGLLAAILATLAGSAASFAVRAARALARAQRHHCGLYCIPCEPSYHCSAYQILAHCHQSYQFRLRRRPGRLPVPFGGYGRTLQLSPGAVNPLHGCWALPPAFARICALPLSLPLASFNSGLPPLLPLASLPCLLHSSLCALPW